MAYFDGYFSLHTPLKEEHRRELSNTIKEIMRPCHWIISTDGTKIEWDGVTPFPQYIPWLMWIYLFLSRREYNINGNIQVEDEQGNSKGTVKLEGNGMSVNGLIPVGMPTIPTWEGHSYDQAMEACLDVIRLKEQTVGGDRLYTQNLFTHEDDNSPLDTSRIMEFTGGDRMYARNLYESRGDDINFKHVIGEGEIPSVPIHNVETTSSNEVKNKESLIAEANLRHLLGTMIPVTAEQPRTIRVESPRYHLGTMPTNGFDDMPQLEDVPRAIPDYPIYVQWSRNNGQTWSEPVINTPSRDMSRFLEEALGPEPSNQLRESQRQTIMHNAIRSPPISSETLRSFYGANNVGREDNEFRDAIRSFAARFSDENNVLNIATSHVRNMVDVDDDVPELVENFIATPSSAGIDLPMPIPQIISGHIHPMNILNPPEIYENEVLPSITFNNDLPRSNTIDEAVRHRVQVIPFRTEWLSPAEVATPTE